MGRKVSETLTKLAGACHGNDRPDWPTPDTPSPPQAELTELA